VFTRRKRVLPSGRPPEEVDTLVQDDPTWALEYNHFKTLCSTGARTDLSNDIWLHRVLARLSGEVAASGAVR
jgi:scyllo-inositol 2-dehydrogenase (NADP+)